MTDPDSKVLAWVILGCEGIESMNEVSFVRTFSRSGTWVKRIGSVERLSIAGRDNEVCGCAGESSDRVSGKTKDTDGGRLDKEEIGPDFATRMHWHPSVHQSSQGGNVLQSVIDDIGNDPTTNLPSI
jgi:hypothetical protein